MEKNPLATQTTRLMLTLPVLLRTPVGDTKIPLPMMHPTITLAIMRMLVVELMMMMIVTVHPLRRVISALSPTAFPSPESTSSFSSVSLKWQWHEYHEQDKGVIFNLI